MQKQDCVNETGLKYEVHENQSFQALHFTWKLESFKKKWKVLVSLPVDVSLITVVVKSEKTVREQASQGWIGFPGNRAFYLVDWTVIGVMAEHTAFSFVIIIELLETGNRRSPANNYEGVDAPLDVFQSNF